MRSPKRLALMAPIAVAAVALSACGSSSKSTGSGGSTPPTTAATSATAGDTSAPSAGDTGSTGASSAPASSSAAASTAALVPVKDGGMLTFGADQEPTGFNTNTDKDNGTAAQNVVESILPSVSIGQPNLGFAFNSNLLDGDPQVVSKSPEVIEYKIKPTAIWSDGTPIGLDDFKFAWQTQNGTDKAYMPAGTTGYEDIASVAGTTDDFKVTFKTPFSDWQALFGNLIPFHTVKAMGGDIHKAWYDGFDTALPVSGGPFELQSYKTGDSAVLVKNPKWYGTAAHLDKIVVRFLPDSTTQVPALQNNEVNLIYPQPQLDLVQQIKDISTVTSSVNFGASFEHIDFNTKTPGLDDVAVRKAIATGVDIKGIIAKTVGQFSDQAKALGNRIFLNTQQQYVDDSAGYGAGDTATANSMLDAAGYAKGADGIRAKGAVKLSFKFTTTEGNDLRLTTFQIFQSQMKALGIDIQSDIRPSKVVFPDLAAKKFQISLFAWVGTPFPVSSNKSIYVTGGGQNYGSLSDPMVDALFTKATAELDPTAVAADANAIDKLLWNDMITIPLFQKPTFIAYDTTYGNIMDNGTSDGPFYNSSDWGLKAS